MYDQCNDVEIDKNAHTTRGRSTVIIARARLYLCTAIVLLCSSMCIRLRLVICMRKSSSLSSSLIDFDVVWDRRDRRVRCIDSDLLLFFFCIIFLENLFGTLSWPTSCRRVDVYTFGSDVIAVSLLLRIHSSCLHFFNIGCGFFPSFLMIFSVSFLPFKD